MSDKLSNHSEKEFREEQSEKVVEFLDRSGAYEYFQDIVSGKEKVPDFKRFEDFITRINGIARDIPISERKFDGVNVELFGALGNVTVPKHEDKEGILKYAYQSIPEINRDDVKYMLPAVINEVHLFNDGNGRTSRIVHLLLSKYKSKEEFFKEARVALSDSGRLESLNIDPGLINLESVVLKNHGWVFGNENPSGKIGILTEGPGHDVRVFGIKKPQEKLAKEFFGMGGSYYQSTAIYMLLGDEGIKPLLKEYKTKLSDAEIGRTAISVKKMLEVLSVEDWKKMIDIFYELKREEAMALVDIFKDPEKYGVGSKGKEKPMKDVFIEDVQKRGNYI